MSLEVLGDRWSLIIVRDIMFGDRRHFRDLQARSEEGIASNILADRLRRLMEAEMLTRADDPSHRQKAIYSLTAKAIDLVPVLVHLGAWGRKYLPTTPELAIRQQLLEEGGPEMWTDFMAELRALHLGDVLPTRHRSVMARLQSAFEAKVASQQAIPDKTSREEKRTTK